MALVMTPIFTQTVGSGGTSSITFNNIPQFYTDLQIEISSRSSATNSGDPWASIQLSFNGSTATRSSTYIYGTGTSASSLRDTSTMYVGFGSTSADATASTFSSSQVYIPNYTSSNFKSCIAIGVAENNAAKGGILEMANLWRNTSAITSITLDGPFVQHSTFSLYGIIRSGA